MIKYCRTTLFLLLLVFNGFQNEIYSLEEKPVTRRVVEEEIPLPPSLREHAKPELPREDNFMGQFIKMLFTLSSIIAILLLISWLLKRYTNSRMQLVNESSEIKILERRNVSPKTSVYLLDIKGRQFAFAESHNALLLLPEVPQNQIYDEE